MYKIGDYYDDGKKQGVVFDVSADGKHGKIVNFTESDDKLSWYPEGFEKTLLVGAEDRFNGLNNMAKVKSKYVCQNCGYETTGYLGKCPECSSWASFVEEISYGISGKITNKKVNEAVDDEFINSIKSF